MEARKEKISKKKILTLLFIFSILIKQKLPFQINILRQILQYKQKR